MKQILIILLLLITTITLSQTTDEIINKHIEAIGGEQNLANLSTLRMNGELGMGDHFKGKMDIIIVKPDKIKYEMEIMGAKVIMVMNGKEGWMYNPMEKGEVEDMDTEDITDLQKMVDLMDPFYNYKSKGLSAEILPDEKVNDKEAYVIKMTGKDSSINYIDKETLLLVRRTGWEKAQKNLFEVNTFFTDFKDFDGFKFATKAVSQSDFKFLNRTVNLNAIEVNKNFADELFNKPVVPQK